MIAQPTQGTAVDRARSDSQPAKEKQKGLAAQSLNAIELRLVLMDSAIRTTG
jgi:hypothetical protein